MPKEYTEAELAKVETAVPNVAGSSVNAAAGKLRESGFNVDIERATGDTVLYQYPAAGAVRAAPVHDHPCSRRTAPRAAATLSRCRT